MIEPKSKSNEVFRFGISFRFFFFSDDDRRDLADNNEEKRANKRFQICSIDEKNVR